MEPWELCIGTTEQKCQYLQIPDGRFMNYLERECVHGDLQSDLNLGPSLESSSTGSPWCPQVGVGKERSEPKMRRFYIPARK